MTLLSIEKWQQVVSNEKKIKLNEATKSNIKMI
jgi:hypothetical protein